MIACPSAPKTCKEACNKRAGAAAAFFRELVVRIAAGMEVIEHDDDDDVVAFRDAVKW